MRRLALLLLLYFAFCSTYATADDMGGIALGGGYEFTATPGFRSFTLNGSTDELQFIFQVPKADTITKVGFRYALRTGTPPTYQVSLQSVSASTGQASGTILGGGSPASATFTPPANSSWDDTWQEVSLTNSYTTTRGQLLAVVIKRSSGTIDGSNNSAFSDQIANLNGDASGFPYAVEVDAGSGSKVGLVPPVSLVSASTVYGTPAKAYTTLDLNSSTTPDEFGVRFKLPSGACGTFKLAGVVLPTEPLGQAGSSFDIVLYEGTTARQTVTIDIDQTVRNTNSKRFYWQDSSLYALSCGTAYRVAIKPTDTDNEADLYYLDVNAANDMKAWPGGGEWFWTQRTDAGSWTDYNTGGNYRVVPGFYLILDDVTGSGGSSGMLFQPGVIGGANG